MNEEFPIIFNGDEAVGSNSENASQVVDSIMQDFYNEMERSILQGHDSNQLIVPSQSSIADENFTTFKALECEDSKISHQNHRTADMACSSVSVVEDPEKATEFPQNCEIPIGNADLGSVHPQVDLSTHHHHNNNNHGIQIVDFSDDCKFDIGVHEIIKSVSDPLLLVDPPKGDPDSKLKENPVDNCNSSTKENQNLLPVTNGSEPTLKCDVNGTEVTPSLNDGQIRIVDIPDNWQISILEDKGSLSHSAEPLIASEQGAYQLWECPKCTALFREKDVCESHINNAHIFTCGMCREPCEGREALEDHVVQHISEFQFIDPLLASNNKRKSEEDSLDDAPSTKRQKLDSQDKASVIETSTLRNATTLNYGNPKIKRDIVIEGSDSQSENVPQFSCSICGKRFHVSRALQMHRQRSHPRTAQTTFSCSVCASTYASQISLQNHMIKHIKKTIPKTIKGYLSNERFEKSSELRQQAVSHEDTYPFDCEFCGLRYKMSAALLNHIKTKHPGGKEHQCGECAKTFKIKSHLQAHISEVHASERKKCRYCNKTYKNQEQLLTHIQHVHYREETKHFDCDYCTLTFNTERKLRKHMEIHLASIQSHECTQCASTFSTAQELVLHAQAHLPYSAGIYNCEWCSRSFDFEKHLSIHVKAHHKPMYRNLMIDPED